MGVNAINKGGRPRKHKYDAVELQEKAEFESLTPEQQAKKIADDVEAGEKLNAYLEAAFKQAEARKVSKDAGKSYPPPIGDVRLSINVKKEVHSKLKSSAAEKGTTIGLLVEMLVIKYL